MPEIIIKDVVVKFPYETPYPVQIKYMEGVIEALNNRRNAFLESPTGTGKTLCLLCATFGWIEHKKNEGCNKRENQNGAMSDQTSNDDTFKSLVNIHGQNYKQRSVPQIIYASKTHSQLQQSMKEMERTEYKHMKAGIVASRDQLCIRDDLQCKSNADKIHICHSLIEEMTRKKRKGPGCQYYGNEQSVIDNLKSSNCSIVDIEDLVRIGRMENTCPYYMAKKIVPDADIVFMPYNYLFDPKIRNANQISLKNAIVIIDEAHNVESMCEDSACTSIKSSKIGIAIRDMEYIIENWSSFEDIEVVNSDAIKLAKIIQKLEQDIFNIERPFSKGYTKEASYIFELLEKVQITENNHESILDILSKLIGALVNLSRKEYKVTEDGIVTQKGPSGYGLRALSSFLRVAFSSSAPDLKDEVNKCYKVHIEPEPDKKSIVNGVLNTEKPHLNAKIIHLLCLSAKFGMRHLLKKNPRSIIFTSGTLAPLKPLIIELGISDPIQLTNPHIVQKFQVNVKIVGRGSDGALLNSSFKNRDKKEYQSSLGNTILKFSMVVPDGLLVFFPSYGVMNKCTTNWRETGIWSLINEQKKIFVEPRTKDEFLDTMKNYYGTINDPNSNGAIFMAVMRGKISEGLDFADMYGRGVIVIGIPLAKCYAQKIVLKKKYLDENRTVANGMLSGYEWYNLSAIRAINQAIGRVIRHKDDYGAIVFCDDRIHEDLYKKDISTWIQPHLIDCNRNTSVDSVIEDLSQFYKNAKQLLPEPKPKLGPEVMDFDEDDEENDDGPTPPTPHKNFCATKSNFCSQYEVERKKQKLLFDQNDNHRAAIVTQKENDALELAGRDFSPNKYKELVEIFNIYKIDGDYESYRDSLFMIFKAERRINLLRLMVVVIQPIHKIDFEKDLNTFLQLNQ